MKRFLRSLVAVTVSSIPFLVSAQNAPESKTCVSGVCLGDVASSLGATKWLSQYAPPLGTKAQTFEQALKTAPVCQQTDITGTFLDKNGNVVKVGLRSRVGSVAGEQYLVDSLQIFFAGPLTRAQQASIKTQAVGQWNLLYPTGPKTQRPLSDTTLQEANSVNLFLVTADRTVEGFTQMSGFSDSFTGPGVSGDFTRGMNFKLKQMYAPAYASRMFARDSLLSQPGCAASMPKF